jgi:hypothetical protein
MASRNDSNQKPKRSRAARKKATADATAKRTRASSPPSAGSESKTAVVDPGTRGEQSPTYEQIAIRAFDIWERQGRPEGQQMDNWLQAERELRGEAAGL